MNIYRNIDRSKVQFDFILDEPSQIFYEKEVLSLGGKVYKFPKFNGTNYFSLKKYWNNFFDEHREYKIIHSHVRSYASIYLKIANKKGLTTIIHSHSTSNGKGIQSLIKMILQYPLRYRVDYFFACSKHSGEWLFGKKLTRMNKVIVINNSIDTSKYKYNLDVRNRIRKNLNISRNTLVLGQVGRLIELKNHLFSLSIMKELKRNQIDFKFLILGDGDLKQDLQKFVIDNNLQNNVIFLGNVLNVYDYLQAMDIYLMPSAYEGLPMSLVEAQSSGLKCIISNNIEDGILVNNLVKQLPLSDSYEWFKEIIEPLDERKDVTDVIVKHGFDSKENAKFFEKFYLDLEQNKNERDL